MQAAALSVSVSKASAGAAHGTPSLDPTKSDDIATGADAFAQALAGLMGVTAAPTPATPGATTSAATTQAVAPAPSAAFAASLPAPSPLLATDDITQPLQAAPPSAAAPPQPAASPPLTAAAAEAIAALTPTPPTPLAAPPAAATPVAAPTPAPASAQTAAAPTLSLQGDPPLAFSALNFTVTLSASTPAATSAVAVPVASVQVATSPAPTTSRAMTATAQPQATPIPAIQPAPAQVAPQPQPPPGDDTLAMPVAALPLTAAETAAALPTSATASVKPLASVSTKVLAKTDAASASGGGGSTPPANPPTTANAVPAAAPVIAQTADRNAKAGSDPSAQAPETPPVPNGADNAGLSGLAAAPVAQQAIVQTPAALAAANGPAIVSQIATQVAKSVDGKSTRFDISLDPAGLGHVNVKVEIGAQGQITAQLSFDNAHTAAEAKSQAGQLQQALEQAGFNIAQGGLSFDVGGQGAGSAGQQGSAPQALATTVHDLSSTNPTAAAATVSSRPASGVDITI